MSDPDREARRSLARHRAFATSLLVVMGVVAVGSHWLPPTYATGLLEAAAKAGFIGGIADWFAVTALFRHPLGLPIPHTAIVPSHKERLGRALGNFVANHVFTESEVARTLSGLDLSGILERFFEDERSSRAAAGALAAMLPRLLASVEDGRARRLLSRLVPRMLGGEAGGRLMVRALRSLVEGGRHQEVFGFVVGQLKATLASKEEELRAAIEERVREHGGRLVGWAVGASIARRVLGAVNKELDKMGPDGSELRLAFDEWVRREIDRIEEDPARAAEIGAGLRHVLANPTVLAWLWDVWRRLRESLERDVADPEGHSLTIVRGMLANLASLLGSDRDLRARVDRALEAMVASLMPAAQAQLSGFIASVVANWDTETLTRRLELFVGRDLQFVRVNGSLVGFLVGGLVYVVLRATFGPINLF
ncbi:MAG TPA: DUF445 domain-containing protein [Acetobacteraceae bacterium]|jgi:uncharacterized membrane-anchored protein YjiN (DUF445 family)|nr:DUF445 domain-containing protein [Acetobacteraceae bacterium]